MAGGHRSVKLYLFDCKRLRVFIKCNFLYLSAAHSVADAQGLLDSDELLLPFYHSRIYTKLPKHCFAFFHLAVIVA